MRIEPATKLACPIDGLPLAEAGTALRRDNGHTFDRAREGYWNLLLVQHKASRDPGDSKEMVAARRRFLDTGHFAPIAQLVFDIVVSLAGDEPLSVADAGCGEGYYLAQLCRHATADVSPHALELAGFDVSKWAVQAAARRKLPVMWLVANNRNPPFLANSVDILLCLFGFPVWQGFRSVQKRGGRVLLVDPGPDHLIELREIAYPSVARSGPPALAQAEPHGYRLEREETLRFEFELETNEAILDLVAMTPHAFRIPAAGHEALSRTDQLRITTDVSLRLLVLDPPVQP